MSMCVYVLGPTTSLRALLAMSTPVMVRSTSIDGSTHDAGDQVDRARALAHGADPALMLRYIRQLCAGIRADRTGPWQPRVGVARTGDSAIDEGACWWRMDGPCNCEFATTAAMSELVVLLWVYACGQYVAGTDPNVLSRDATAARQSIHRSAAAFAWLARLGAKEGAARFDADAPPMFKGYICRALELAALAFAHILEANAIFAEPNSSARVTISMTATKHAIAASARMQAAVDVIADTDGADDAGALLHPEFSRVLRYVRAWGTFHHAMSHFYTSKLNESAANAHMSLCISTVADIREMTKTMAAEKAAANANVQRSWTDNLSSAFQYTILAARPPDLPDPPGPPAIITPPSPIALAFPPK